MTQNKNQNISYTQTGIVLQLPTSGFKDPKEFDFNKDTSNSSKGCVLKVDLEYPKELRELHNDYTLASDKIEIKREMLSDYN